MHFLNRAAYVLSNISVSEFDSWSYTLQEYNTVDDGNIRTGCIQYIVNDGNVFNIIYY